MAGSVELEPSEFPHSRSILKLHSNLRLLVLGDSVGAGLAASTYRATFASLWAAHLRDKYGAPIHLINLSRAGASSEYGAELAVKAGTEYKPDLAVIAFGLNDQKREPRRWRRPRTWRQPIRVAADAFRTNILRTADRIRRRSGADVVLVSPCPLPGLTENDLYRAALVSIAERTDFALADVSAAWPADASAFFAPDGLHPNDAGHRIYADTLIALGV